MKTPHTVSVPHIYQSIRTRQKYTTNLCYNSPRTTHNTESHMKTLSPQPSTLLNTHIKMQWSLQEDCATPSVSSTFLSTRPWHSGPAVKRERLLLFSMTQVKWKGLASFQALKQKPHLKIKVSPLLDMW